MTVRDAEKLKDKIEVSLDGRQVFFLFFGGAVVASLVFVLGVMVGKRLEARERVAHKASTSAQVDPLAALDELGADEQADEKGDDLAFATALAADARKAAAAPAPAPPLAVAEKPPEKVAEKPDKADKSEAKAKDKDNKDNKDKDKKSKFTLQISSFQERAEADSLVAKLAASGYKPYMVMSNVPDKGVFFRVRIGEYGNKSDALDAKMEFEKKQHLLAYVTKM